MFETTMRGLLLRWLLYALALWVTSWLIQGIEVSNPLSLLLASLVLGVLNAVIRPIVILLTLPLTILTLGLFIFVINAFLLLLTSSVVAGFEVHGFGAAFVGAIILSIVSWALNALVNDQGRLEFLRIRF